MFVVVVIVVVVVSIVAVIGSSSVFHVGVPEQLDQIFPNFASHSHQLEYKGIALHLDLHSYLLPDPGDSYPALLALSALTSGTFI